MKRHERCRICGSFRASVKYHYFNRLFTYSMRQKRALSPLSGAKVPDTFLHCTLSSMTFFMAFLVIRIAVELLYSSFLAVGTSIGLIGEVVKADLTVHYSAALHSMGLPHHEAAYEADHFGW